MNRITVEGRGGRGGRYDIYIVNNNTGIIIYFPLMLYGLSENINANFTQQDTTFTINTKKTNNLK
jgi:hypothetical protein